MLKNHLDLQNSLHIVSAFLTQFPTTVPSNFASKRGGELSTKNIYETPSLKRELFFYLPSFYFFLGRFSQIINFILNSTIDLQGVIFFLKMILKYFFSG